MESDPSSFTRAKSRIRPVYIRALNCSSSSSTRIIYQGIICIRNYGLRVHPHHPVGVLICCALAFLDGWLAGIANDNRARRDDDDEDDKRVGKSDLTVYSD